MLEDKTSVEQLYSAHYHKIRRYLIRLVGDKDADDLAQEVFIKAAKALGSFSNLASPSTWLYRIATNTALDSLKNCAGKREQAYPDNMPADEAPSTVDQLIRREMNDCIQAYVGSLPENYRTVLVLSELEGLKNNEIAAILGLSLATVKIRLHRAREKLRQELTANCIFYRTDCNQLACEPKGPFKKLIKPLPKHKC